MSGGFSHWAARQSPPGDLVPLARLATALALPKSTAWRWLHHEGLPYVLVRCWWLSPSSGARYAHPLAALKKVHAEAFFDAASRRLLRRYGLSERQANRLVQRSRRRTRPASLHIVSSVERLARGERPA